MKRRTILILLSLIAIAAGIYAWREYDRGLMQASGAEAAETLDATALLAAFTTDEAAANARFNDKVVQVAGTVRSVSGPENGKVTVMLDTGDPLSAIACEFVAGHAPELHPGGRATIKGFCAGFNMDVLLQRCAAVE